MNKKEPQPILGKAEAPDWLMSQTLSTAVDIYNELAALLVPLRVLTIADQQALADLADKIALQRKYRKVMYRGVSYETRTQSGSIMKRLQPEVGPYLDLSRQIAQGLATFGLTPASRTKIQTVGDHHTDPLEEFLGNGS